MNGAKLAFSHDSLAMIKWTVCRHRETVCLLKVRRETDAVPSGDEWGGWWMGDALNAMGVERRPTLASPFFYSCFLSSLALQPSLWSMVIPPGARV
jgi:hypothetical protein